MSLPDENFDDLIARARNGSPEAAKELIRRYSRHVLRVVRRRLPDALRSEFDSVDFVQAAWVTLFEHVDLFDRLDGPDAFVAFLATVAANKVSGEIRSRLGGQRRSLPQKYSLDDSECSLADECYARDPTGSDIAIVHETWLQIIAKQPAHYQQIANLRRHGYAIEEIAEKVGVNERTVRRAIKTLHKVYLARVSERNRTSAKRKGTAVKQSRDR